MREREKEKNKVTDDKLFGLNISPYDGRGDDKESDYMVETHFLPLRNVTCVTQKIRYLPLASATFFNKKYYFNNKLQHHPHTNQQLTKIIRAKRL
jgi:hypothetical protein